ncbi:IclR family pca regulon transcriptional regulator [Novosphingobium chloroacetimidivorans]|uniref:IclR family pca regulon transcriptional regulator n=1 Tax=Novosphingobium chloroacetimidivorans TaxID=1428314 RepID=A0A7W7K812_9SPHN|nr:IclR family transcriptional regulator C-terminal domain-containing protein [Novosphingobium chloroacetimidivorans]MBB4857957.1 IclR family pca regulon transcriptional regulator [Novosphingobium chloroacetimidivorans]
MTKLRESDAVQRRESGRSGDFLEVLARAIRVMEAMGAGASAMSISDVARLTDLPKPSVRRVLHTLRDLGYAESVGRAFRLTPKVVRLAASFLGANGHARILQEACDRLSEQTGQSSLVAVLDGDQILVIAYALPESLMAPFRGIGSRIPAIASAAGRVLMAALAPGDLAALMARIEQSSALRDLGGDMAQVKAQIHAAREQGYSTSDDEYVIGWRTFACPLYRYDGELFGAISLNCKKRADLDEVTFQNLAAQCAQAASDLQPLLV